VTSVREHWEYNVHWYDEAIIPTKWFSIFAISAWIFASVLWHGCLDDRQDIQSVKSSTSSLLPSCFWHTWCLRQFKVNKLILEQYYFICLIDMLCHNGAYTIQLEQPCNKSLSCLQCFVKASLKLYSPLYTGPVPVWPQCSVIHCGMFSPKE